MRGIIIITFMILAAAVAYLSIDDDWNRPAETEPAVVPSSDRAPGADAAENDDQALRRQAADYVSDLTVDSNDPIAVQSADDFVSGSQSLALDKGHEPVSISIAELAADDSLAFDDPITLVREQRQIEMVSIASLIKRARGDLNTRITLFENDQTIELPLSELVAGYRPNLEHRLAVISRVEHYELTTKRALLDDPELDQNETIRIIKQPRRLATATVDELLMGQRPARDDGIYYVRHVGADDVQGLWGIVHDGLVTNFAAGIAVRRGEDIEHYQVEIPANADEVRRDHSSSFLGLLIDRKTSQSYVYNYSEGKMGKSPDLIYPGQEIVIIGFTTEELVQIYRHFVARAQSLSLR